MPLSTLPSGHARAATARARYVTDTVETVSPSRLVTMLYDALMRDLVLAEDTLNGTRDLRLVNDRLVHAQATGLELQTGPDPTKGEGGPGVGKRPPGAGRGHPRRAGAGTRPPKGGGRPGVGPPLRLPPRRARAGQRREGRGARRVVPTAGRAAPASLARGR